MCGGARQIGYAVGERSLLPALFSLFSAHQQNWRQIEVETWQVSIYRKQAGCVYEVPVAFP